MSLSRYINMKVKELTVVALCFLCCAIAYPSRLHHGTVGNQRGVIPLNHFISQLQVDIPDYQTESFPPGMFTGGAKRKRHGHLNIHFSHKKSESEETDKSGSCCPTIEEIVEPRGGRSKSGMLVELFQAEDLHQQFHEISCATNVVDQPCRFVNEEYVGKSRCVQQYSYSYALVRDYPSPTSKSSQNSGDSGWRFDHIRVPSGCSCIISPS